MGERALTETVANSVEATEELIGLPGMIYFLDPFDSRVTEMYGYS